MRPSGCGDECVGEKEGYSCSREQSDMEGTNHRFRQHGQLVVSSQLVAIIAAIFYDLP